MVNENFHGLDRAKGYDHLSMELQAKLTAFAVNLKRIAAILSSLKGSNVHYYFIFIQYKDENVKMDEKCA